MKISRKRFLGTLAGASVTLWLQGCGGGGGDSPGVALPTSPCGAGLTNITGNHGHTLTIPRADLDSLVNKTYQLAAATTDGHIHNVTFTPTQLTTMKGGGTVTVTTSTAVGHAHDVSASVGASCA